MTASKSLSDHLVITTGTSCNNHCIMCSIRHSGIKHPDASTAEIIDRLKKERANQCQNVDFSGGEPTYRQDLVELIRHAKNIGYKRISISTNGILLKDDHYFQELINAGLNSVNFSLHAHNSQLGAIISKNPEAFEATISGIQNAIQHKLDTYVSTVVFKPNYRHIHQIGELVYSLGVPSWGVFEMLPDGLAQENYSQFCIKKKDYYHVLLSLEDLLKEDSRYLVLGNVTPCAVPRSILLRKNTIITTIPRKHQQSQFKNYVGKNKQVFKTSSIDDFNQQFLTKTTVCENCPFSESCSGIWSDYLHLYGDTDIAQLRKNIYV